MGRATDSWGQYCLGGIWWEWPVLVVKKRPNKNPSPLFNMNTYRQCQNSSQWQQLEIWQVHSSVLWHQAAHQRLHHTRLFAGAFTYQLPVSWREELPRLLPIDRGRHVQPGPQAGHAPWAGHHFPLPQPERVLHAGWSWRPRHVRWALSCTASFARLPQYGHGDLSCPLCNSLDWEPAVPRHREGSMPAQPARQADCQEISLLVGPWRKDDRKSMHNEGDQRSWNCHWYHAQVSWGASVAGRDPWVTFYDLHLLPAGVGEPTCHVQGIVFQNLLLARYPNQFLHKPRYGQLQVHWSIGHLWIWEVSGKKTPFFLISSVSPLVGYTLSSCNGSFF